MRLAERASVVDRQHPWLATFAGVLGVYLLTAHWAVGQNQDSIAAVWPAWSFVHMGSFRLDGVPNLPDSPWFARAADGSLVSFRTMGVILASIPAQAALSWTDLRPEVGGALTASLLTAGAVANVRLLLLPTLGRSASMGAAAVLAFGTGCWTVAAAEMWTHGPDLFWISAGLLAASRQRWVLAGACLAPAVATRPHVAVITAVIGLYFAIEKRSVKVLACFAVPSGLALGVLYLWNRWYYGVPGLAGGYDNRASLALRAPGEAGPSVLGNWLGGLFSPGVGVLLFTPLLAVSVWALASNARHRLRSPRAFWAMAVAALLYETLQFRLNRFDGGGDFYGSRLMLEGELLSLPLLAHATCIWMGFNRARRACVAAMAGISIAIHATGAVLTYYWRGTPGGSDWRIWYPAHVVQAAGIHGYLVATTAGLAAVIGTCVAVQRTPTAEQPPAGATQPATA
jgi:hypothetical protein